MKWHGDYDNDGRNIGAVRDRWNKVVKNTVMVGGLQIAWEIVDGRFEVLTDCSKLNDGGLDVTA